MREQFEKLPEIKKRLISVKFNEALNRYESKNPVLIECLEVALFLNGAWYAYQEQQKKIDALLDHTCGTYEGWQGGVLIGEEYDSLKGTKGFLGQCQEKLGNQS